MRKSDPAKAMQALETIYLFYGEGEHWTRGIRHDSRGKHCLVGAIELHCKHPGTMRAVVDYIGAAIWPRSDREYSLERLMTFNDLCSGSDRICNVLVRARELARRDMERQQPEIAAALAAQRLRRTSGKRRSVVIHADRAAPAR